MVIYTGAERCHDEIEVSPLEHDAQRVHTDVSEPMVNGHTVYAAVYLPLVAGDYTIWGPDPERPTVITIVAGGVTEIDWR